jgi:uncharacterized delta-60 repeat protein
MWPFTSRQKCSTTSPLRRSAFRPRLEFLEDRCTPSAGMLDPTFNPTGSPPGIAAAPVGSSTSVTPAASVLVQPSGKVVVPGWCNTNTGQQFCAVCFNANGSPDLTFGSGGAAVTTNQGTKQANNCSAATLYPTGGPGDQKILEVGQGVSGGHFAVVLVRFNANGSLDTSFGTKGYVFTDIQPSLGTGPDYQDVVLQANGTALPKIVVTATDQTSLYMIRYNPDGTIDKSFGKAGVVTYQPPNFTGSERRFHLAQGGAAGADLIVTGEGVLLAFTPNGAFDTNFGGTGVVPTPQFPSYTHAAYQADGKIVLAYAGGALARYNANGTLDAFFGSGGVVSTTISPRALTLQADGKIVVNGAGVLARYNPDGSLDGTFGTGGITPPGAITDPLPSQSVVIAPNGDIVIGGLVGADLAAARYLPSEPEIGSVTAAQSGAGAPVTLTASNLTDANPNSTIKQVTFYYYDALGNQVVLETVTAPDGSGNWDLTVSLPAGSYTLYAQAEDSYGDLGDPFALNLTVQ